MPTAKLEQRRYNFGVFLFEVFGNTGILMLVARIEFYTMLMRSVVFLPFGVTERLAFLSNSAISLMFNSGAKMVVIMPEVKNAMLNTEKIAEHIDEESSLNR